MELKQVIVMRTDLNMRKGKMISQGAHASGMPLVHALLHLDTIPEKLHGWIGTGVFTKVTVRANSEQELMDVYARAQAAGIEAYLITDCGKTEFHGVPTKTCISIGPDEIETIDQITGNMTLL